MRIYESEDLSLWYYSTTGKWDLQANLHGDHAYGKTAQEAVEKMRQKYPDLNYEPISRI